MVKIHEFFAKRLFILAILSLLLLLIGQVLGRYSWQAELFSHFVPYYAMVLLLAGLIRPIDNSRVKIGLRALFLVVGVGLIIYCLPSYQLLKKSYELPKPPLTPPTVLLAYQNVNISNTDKANTLKQLTRHDPKILILLEAGGDWSEYLKPLKQKPLKQKYPVHCGHDESSPFAMQVFAQDKQTKCEIIYSNSQQKSLPMIKLTLANQQVIYAIHPPPPINQQLADNRLHYLQSLHQRILQEKADTAIMVVGDMNTTAFSPLYRDFIKGTNLQANTANGLPTWLPFAIGIDHILSNDGQANTIRVKAMDWYGSDHRGFLVLK